MENIVLIIKDRVVSTFWVLPPEWWHHYRLLYICGESKRKKDPEFGSIGSFFGVSLVSESSVCGQTAMQSTKQYRVDGCVMNGGSCSHTQLHPFVPR
eukprot:scaffold12163_cov176-Amphora_coffeaeformis.AAC.18